MGLTAGEFLGEELAMNKVKVGIIGSGNIGTDLLLKLLRSPVLKPAIMVGIDPASEGLRIAEEQGVKASSRGIEDLLKEDVLIVFDASGAKPHLRHAPLLKNAGRISIDLTPAAVGPPVVPYINLKEHLDAPDVNLITCGGQATIPLVWAINRVAPVSYAEIVSTISSRSAGIGTRQNIDEFTETTARSLETLGGARRGKAIIILNPAEPPIIMRNTVYAIVEEERNTQEIVASLRQIVERIQTYVPGYHLKHEPDIEGKRVTVQIEVEGAGDYLPRYSGNLDIMTAAAVAVGEEFARERAAKEAMHYGRGGR
jgi:acetaldehyde dehydrogenase